MEIFSRQQIEKSGPGPYYLTSLTVDDNGYRAEGKALFPLSEPSIAARGDHANLMHLLPALWNAVHCMKKTFGMEISRLPSGTWNAFALTVPEEEITVRVEVLHMSKDHKYGTFRGEFFDGSGNLLATFMNNFVATKLI